MSVNLGYYGDDWSTVVPVPTNNQNYQKYYDLGIKRPNFTSQTASSGYDIYKGGWGVKALGADFYQPFDYSIAWCAMDKNAPQLSKAWCNPAQLSGVNPVSIEFSTVPTSNSPVFMSAVPLYSGQRFCKWFGANATNTPTDYLPWNIVKGVGSPTGTTTNGVTAARVVSWCENPVVSFPFKNFVLTPIVVAAKLKEGKTLADLDSYPSDTPESTVRSEMFAGIARADLKSYFDSNNVNYLNYPVVLQVMLVAQCVLYDENGVITTTEVGGRRDTYPSFSPRAFERDNMKFEAHDPYTEQSTETQFEFNTSLCSEMISPSSFTGWVYANNATTAATFSNNVANPILGSMFLYNTYTTRTADSYTYMFGNYMRGGSKWHIRETGDSSTVGYSGLYHFVFTTVGDNGEFTADEFKEYVRSAVAYYGMYFTDGLFITGLSTTSSDMMLGIIDNNGITHGEYSEGPDNANQRQADWEDPIEDTPFNPDSGDGGSDDTPEDGGYSWTRGSLNLPSTFAYINVQLATYNEVRDLTNWFSMTTKGWDNIETVTVDEFRLHLLSMQANFQNTYPEECLKMIRLMPFDMPTKLTVTSFTPSPFQLGSTRTIAYDNYSGTQIPAATCLHAASASAVYNWTSEPFEVPTWYGDFRDFEPYTRIELSVPFCGTVNLDAAEFMGHVVQVEMQMDCIWGAVTAIILRDGQAYATLNGKIGVEIPFEVDAIGAFINTQVSNSFSTANAKLALNTATANTIQSGSKFIGKAAQSAVALSAGAPVSAIGLGDTVNAGFDLYRQEQNREIAHNNYEAARATLEHTAMGRSMMGQGESATQFFQDYHIVLTVHRPRMMNYNPTTYGKAVGFACDTTGRVGSFSGYTEFANVILDEITATDDMKALILQRLQSGVII